MLLALRGAIDPAGLALRGTIDPAGLALRGTIDPAGLVLSARSTPPGFAARFIPPGCLLYSAHKAPLTFGFFAGAADALVKVARGHVDLFRAALPLLPPGGVQEVQQAMGRAAQRAAARQPRRAAAAPAAGPGGGLKLNNLSAYR